jgi:hypothetical protein
MLLFKFTILNVVHCQQAQYISNTAPRLDGVSFPYLVFNYKPNTLTGRLIQFIVDIINIKI